MPKNRQRCLPTILALAVAAALPMACGGGSDSPDAASVDASSDASGCATGPGIILRLVSAPAPFSCGDPPSFKLIDVTVDVGAGHVQEQFFSGQSELFIAWPAASMTGDPGQVMVASSGPGDCSGSGTSSFTADVAVCQEVVVELSCSCGAPDAGP